MRSVAPLFLAMLVAAVAIPAAAADNSYLRLSIDAPILLGTGIGGGNGSIPFELGHLDDFVGRKGAEFSRGYQIVGAPGPLNWTLSTILPSGVDFSQGAFSGHLNEIGTFPVSVSVSDTGTPAQTDTDQFTLRILPELAVSGASYADLRTGKAFTSPPPVYSGLVDGETAQFRLIDAFLGASIDPQTGVISGTPTSEGVFGSRIALMSAFDGLEVVSTPFQFTVIGTPVVSLPAIGTLPLGKAFSLAPIKANVVAPAVWSIIGSKPAWLSINSSTGSLSGTPTSAGSASNLKVSVIDKDGLTAESEPFVVSTGFEFAVVPPSGPAATFRVGAGVAATITQNSAQTVAWSLASGPSWLSIAANGALQGNAPLVGTFNYVSRATLPSGSYSEASGTITIVPALTFSAHPAALTTNPGTKVTTQTTVSGTGTLTYQIVNGSGGTTSVPSWLTVSSSGLVSAAPPASTAYADLGGFRVKVSDPYGSVTSNVFAVNVVQAPVAVEYILQNSPAQVMLEPSCWVSNGENSNCPNTLKTNSVGPTTFLFALVAEEDVKEIIVKATAVSGAPTWYVVGRNVPYSAITGVRAAGTYTLPVNGKIQYFGFECLGTAACSIQVSGVRFVRK